MKIKTGATVYLKTASPQMSIVETRPNGGLVCEWMHDGMIQSESFSIPALRTENDHATVKGQRIKSRP